jgi:hypothetical protein
MHPSISNQAATALLNTLGETVTINGLPVRAVVIRNVRSEQFGQVARYHLSPNMVSVKVSGTPDAFTDATVVLDGKTYRVSEANKTGSGLVNMLCRLQA